MRAQRHLPANPRPSDFRQAALPRRADLAPSSAGGKGAASAPTFLPACAFPDTFTLCGPALGAADPTMRDGALPLGEARCTWGSRASSGSRCPGVWPTTQPGNRPTEAHCICYPGRNKSRQGGVGIEHILGFRILS